MKAKPMRRCEGGLEPCKPEEATHVLLNVPGPYPTRLIPVDLPGGPRRAGPTWTWNRDTEKPTLSPSILTDMGPDGPKCHSYVRKGKIQFLRDCGHELAGQTLDLLDVD